jgi:hypothetical protein
MKARQITDGLLSITHPTRGRFRMWPDRIERLDDRGQWQTYWPSPGDPLFSGRWGLGTMLGFLRNCIEQENKHQIALFPHDNRERWVNWIQTNFSLAAVTHASRFVRSAWKMLFFFGQTGSMGLELFETNPALAMALAEHMAQHPGMNASNAPARPDVASYLGFTEEQTHLLRSVEASHLFYVSCEEVYRLRAEEAAWRFSFLAQTDPQPARIMALFRLPRGLVTHGLIHSAHSPWDDRYSLTRKDLSMDAIMEFMPHSRLPVQPLQSVCDLYDYQNRLENEALMRCAGLCPPTCEGGTYPIEGADVAIDPVRSLDDVRAVGQELFISPLASAPSLPAVAEWVNYRYEPRGFVSQYGIHAEGRAVGLMFVSEDLEVQHVVGRFGDVLPSFYQAAILAWVREERAAVTL